MTIVFHYTESMMKAANASYIGRFFMTKMFGFSIFSVCLLLLCLCFVNSTWIKACAAVPVILIPAFLVFGYWLRILQSLKKLAKLDDGKVSVTLSDSGVATDSAIGKMEVYWDIFTELWEFPAYYLLISNGGWFLTLPREQVSPEFIDFIRNHLKPA